MLKEGHNPMAGGGWALPCNSCRSAVCTVYCPADSAYLCAGCDARVHAADLATSRHEHVWACEACGRAPATLTCKADAAALCAACDAEIHSANTLACRHHRFPILPISMAGGGPSRTSNPLLGQHHEEEEEEEDWLSSNPVKNGYCFDGEVDEYLDLVGYNSCTDNQNQDGFYSQQKKKQQLSNHGKHEASDGVVPVPFIGPNENQIQHHHQQQQSFHVDYDTPKNGFSHSSSLSRSVSLSSMEGGVVLETAVIEISNSNNRPSKGTIDLFSGPPHQMPPQFAPSVDREARVLRYREKRKARKFEKTIRYASRKAYAEARPRIKGRFAKRSDVESEVDQMFALTDSSYGVVPSF